MPNNKFLIASFMYVPLSIMLGGRVKYVAASYLYASIYYDTEKMFWHPKKSLIVRNKRPPLYPLYKH